MVYLINVKDQNQPASTTLIADGSQHTLRVEGREIPVTLTYTATCDQKTLSGLLWSQTLSDSASEKFTISKNPNGSLKINDQSVILGKVTQEQIFVCERM
jgi:hypothetical protein